jgi:hypothetical protein
MQGGRRAMRTDRRLRAGGRRRRPEPTRSIPTLRARRRLQPRARSSRSSSGRQAGPASPSPLPWSVAFCGKYDTHSIITGCRHMLSTGELYQEAGGDYFTRRDPERATRRLVAQLERLGHRVNVGDVPAGARRRKRLDTRGAADGRAKSGAARRQRCGAYKGMTAVESGAVAQAPSCPSCSPSS